MERSCPVTISRFETTSILDGITVFLLQISPSAKVDITTKDLNAFKLKQVVIRKGIVFVIS